MFKINDDLSIYLTRGDAVVFDVQAKQGDGLYQFEAGDKVVFKVSEAKNTVDAILAVDGQRINDNTMQFKLESSDTILDTAQINKPVDFWYEISLITATGTQTLIGYDEDGAKVLRLFPEIGEKKGTGE